MVIILNHVFLLLDDTERCFTNFFYLSTWFRLYLDEHVEKETSLWSL